MAAKFQSAVTLCLVPEAQFGPFVFHTDVSDGCARARQAGFDAVEVFPRSAEEVDARELKRALDGEGLKLAAMGTGAGALVQKLTLTHEEAGIRRRAVDFIGAIIDLAAGFGAPAIIGSMQGMAPAPDRRDASLERLGQALEQLGPRAHAAGVTLLIEPLNRYESNLLNRLEPTARWLETLSTRNVKILADLFHMNIEEPLMDEAIRQAGSLVGHVHFADSNRQAVGQGHSPIAPVIAALQKVNYQGYLSAEIFPRPDAEEAARRTVQAFQQFTSS